MTLQIHFNLTLLQRQNILVSFPLAVAQSVTVDQRSGLVTEMANALDYVIYGDTRGGSSKCCPGSKYS